METTVFWHFSQKTFTIPSETMNLKAKKIKTSRRIKSTNKHPKRRNQDLNWIKIKVYNIISLKK